MTCVFLLVIFLQAGIAHAAATLLVTLTQSETLEEAIKAAPGYSSDGSITALKITTDAGAEITETDWIYLKSLSALQSLDLSGAVCQDNEIPEEAMEGNTSLQTIVFPNGLETIEDSAFEGCTGLKDGITIPETVTLIGESAFENAGAPSEAGRIVFAGTPEISVIDEYAFAQSTFNGTLDLPDSLTAIGEYAFYNCNFLTGLNLPRGGSLKTISAYAFAGCYRIQTNVIIPASVLTIEQSAFENFSGNSMQIYSLQFATGSLLNSIADNAFLACSLGGTVTFPDSLSSIGASAFAHNYNITEITFPDNGGLSIGDSAFEYNVKLRAFDFQSTYQSVGQNAFAYCALDLSEDTPEGKMVREYDNGITTIAPNQRPYFIAKAPSPFSVAVNDLSNIDTRLKPTLETMYGNPIMDILTDTWMNQQVDWLTIISRCQATITKDGQSATINAIGVYDVSYSVPSYIYGTANPDSTVVTVTEASAVPSATVTPEPTQKPTQAPTAEPTQAPTAEPTQTALPTESESISAQPSESAETSTTVKPTEKPTQTPTVTPTQNSSLKPLVSESPSVQPQVSAIATQTPIQTSQAPESSSSQSPPNTQVTQDQSSTSAGSTVIYQTNLLKPGPMPELTESGTAQGQSQTASSSVTDTDDSQTTASAQITPSGTASVDVQGTNAQGNSADNGILWWILLAVAVIIVCLVLVNRYRKRHDGRG
ncbi:MAG: leucine-rich repeat protein [Christensenella sp.]|nr:leucine-rich repeat protein [Christensenella sp.]